MIDPTDAIAGPATELRIRAEEMRESAADLRQHAESKGGPKLQARLETVAAIITRAERFERAAHILDQSDEQDHADAIRGVFDTPIRMRLGNPYFDDASTEFHAEL